jgi:acetate kinase
MQILVLNCGSSSVKADVINPVSQQKILSVCAERIKEQALLEFSDGSRIEAAGSGFDKVLSELFNYLKEKLGPDALHGVGHRVAHGGSQFHQPVRITEEVERAIEDLGALAPLHNPVHLRGIRLARAAFPDLPHVAVFDTAFHHTLPRRAHTYALPTELMEKHGLRRFGFHGTSHQYVAQVAAQHLGRDYRELRIITCHLGSGASVCAIEYGRSVETSMGMTPLEGLVMNTRSGDIDPGILLWLAEQENMSIQDLDQLLNRESGLKGLSGQSGDMRDIMDRATHGDERCRLAIQVFTHRVRKYIGAYAAIMDGVDAIVFTGGIGENSPVIRQRIAQRLDYMGALLNEDHNLDIRLSDKKPAGIFSSAHSRVALLAVRTDEQLAIARKTRALIEDRDKVNTLPAIPVAISARHVHLTQEAVETLFGKGHQLTLRRWLKQPGQFAAEESVTLVGPKNRIERVRILGPCRNINQVEISRTDEFTLGIDAPVRESGKIENSPGIRLEGPAGSLKLEQGVICAWRHIHMHPDDAEKFGVQDADIVEVAVGAGPRQLVFGNVLVRVSPNFVLEMHIDTDEGNAAEIHPGTEGVLLETSSEGTLRKRQVVG